LFIYSVLFIVYLWLTLQNKIVRENLTTRNIKKVDTFIISKLIFEFVNIDLGTVVDCMVLFFLVTLKSIFTIKK